MTALLLEAALRSLILGLLVGACLRIFRVRDPQLEMTAWITVLAASLAMPLLMQWTILRLPAAPVALPTVLTGGDPAGLAPGFSADPAGGGGFRAEPGLFFFLYATVACVLLLRLATGLAMTWRIVRAARPVRAGWAAGADIRFSPAVKAPVTFGRVILLPIGFVAWPAAKRRAVLCHERAHVEHRDFLVQTVAALHCALFWFSPFAWWLRARLSMLAEQTSDEAAVAGIGNRIGYAEILLDIAASARGLPAGIAMARPAMLRQRVERILAGRVPSAAPAPRHRLVLAASLLPSVLAVAGTAWHAGAAEAPMMDERPASDGLAFAILADGRTIIGGSTADRERLMALRGRVDGPAMLFLRDGRVYEILDRDLVEQAAVEQQRALGERRAELSRQRAELSRQQSELTRRIGELGRQRAELPAGQAEALGAGGRIPDPGAESARQQDELNRAIEQLGREQGRLGRDAAELGREQSRLARDSDRRIRSLIDRAVDRGMAAALS